MGEEANLARTSDPFPDNEGKNENNNNNNLGSRPYAYGARLCYYRTTTSENFSNLGVLF